MSDGRAGHVYRGYHLDVTRRRDDKTMLWNANFRVGGKFGTIYRGDSAAYADFLLAEAEAAKFG